MSDRVLLVAALVALAPLAAPGGAWAGGLRMLEDAWLWDPLGPHDDLAPAPDAPGHFVGAAAGLGRLFGMEALPVMALRAAAGRRFGDAVWGCAGGWQRLGGETLRIDRLELEAGRSGQWRYRMRAEAERQVLAGVPAPGRVRIGAVVGWRWSAAAGCGGSCDLHLSLRDDMAHDPRYVAPRLRLATRLPPATVVVAWDRRGDGTPLLGFEILVDLARSAAVSCRFDGGSRSFGWGIVLRRDSLLVRSSHLVHPDLGTSHRWQLAAGAARPPAAPGW